MTATTSKILSVLAARGSSQELEIQVDLDLYHHASLLAVVSEFGDLCKIQYRRDDRRMNLDFEFDAVIDSAAVRELVGEFFNRLLAKTLEDRS